MACFFAMAWIFIGIGEHLHIYVDRVILELMVKLAKDKCLGTIQDVFTDTYLLLNKKKKI